MLDLTTQESEELWKTLDPIVAVILDQVTPPHENANCHLDLTSREKCMRCKQVVAATVALGKLGYFLPTVWWGNNASTPVLRTLERNVHQA